MDTQHQPKHPRKKISEYFFDFLMLFLAVTLGFFAENLREHINVNEATRKNMIAMISDLRSDSVMFQNVITGNLSSKLMDDTLIRMLSDKDAHTGHIYFLARNITAVLDVIRPNTRTFEQLKSGGTLQLIRKEGILHSITSYYQSLKWFDQQNQILLR